LFLCGYIDVYISFDGCKSFKKIAGDKEMQSGTPDDFPTHDPITGSAFTISSSWTLIYNSSCGLDGDPGRNSFGETQTFAYNFIAYSSYRILITSQLYFNTRKWNYSHTNFVE
jgi:hypothetical protein